MNMKTHFNPNGARLSYEWNVFMLLLLLGIYQLTAVAINFFIIYTDILIIFRLASLSFSTFLDSILLDFLFAFALLYITYVLFNTLKKNGTSEDLISSIVLLGSYFFFNLGVFYHACLTIQPFLALYNITLKSIVLISIGISLLQTIDLYLFLQFQKGYIHCAKYFKNILYVFSVICGIFLGIYSINLGFSDLSMGLKFYLPRLLWFGYFLGIATTSYAKASQFKARITYYEEANAYTLDKHPDKRKIEKEDEITFLFTEWKD
jgi:hypothetical protein